MCGCPLAVFAWATRSRLLRHATARGHRAGTQNHIRNNYLVHDSTVMNELIIAYGNYDSRTRCFDSRKVATSWVSNKLNDNYV